MWHHNNSGGPGPPPPPPQVSNGMWAAPGHNPMMESQWTAHFQSMAASQVDWAALAQQWIAMKGSSSLAPAPAPAPAPPNISNNFLPTPPPTPSFSQPMALPSRPSGIFF